MAYVINFFGGGYALFVGVSGVLAGLAIFALFASSWRKPAGSALAGLGLLLIALSATPLPYLAYVALGVVSILWLFAERSERDRWRTARRPLRHIVLGTWLAAVGFEVPYWLPPHLPASGRPTLYVIGDSVSAGLSDSDANTWPKVLARTHDIDVADFSQMGAKAASALKQAQRLPESGGLVLLEIGGNDLLGGTSSERFERDLDALMMRTCAADRVTLMFELPLPPFSNEFGRIQRQLAAKYGVRLIPKRVFAAVLTGDKMTVDGVHLSRAGHERMAEIVWETIRGAYGD